MVRLAPKSRQTVLFSATMTDEVNRLGTLSLRAPVRLAADEPSTAPVRLSQEVLRLKVSGLRLWEPGLGCKSHDARVILGRFAAWWGSRTCSWLVHELLCLLSGSCRECVRGPAVQSELSCNQLSGRACCRCHGWAVALPDGMDARALLAPTFCHCIYLPAPASLKGMRG